MPIREAYLRLIEVSAGSFRDRAHFFGMCALLMRGFWWTGRGPVVRSSAVATGGRCIWTKRRWCRPDPRSTWWTGQRAEGAGSGRPSQEPRSGTAFFSAV